MKKIYIIITVTLLFLAGCSENESRSFYNEPYNLKLEKMEAVSDTFVGYPVKVNMTVTSDREAENVPYTLLLINKSDYDSEVEEPRYISLGEFEAIDVIEEGTNDYEVQAVIPNDNDQSGEYYLVGLIDPAGDIEGDEGKLDNIELVSDSNLYAVVNLDTSHLDKTDFSVSEINLTSVSDQQSENNSFVIRDTDNVSDPVITGSVTINTLGINSQLNVPVSVYIMNGNELVPCRLWDREVKGYVEKYYIAELSPEKPSVLHFSIILPAETRSYLRQLGNSDLSLTVVMDPDNDFEEPEITNVLSGENNNMAKTDITIIYDSGDTLKAGSFSTKSGMSIDVTTSGQWFEKVSTPTARTGAASVEYNGKIYVFGGRDSSGTVLDTIDIYDIAGNTWTASSVTLSIPRCDHSAVVCSVSGWDDYIYIIGGRDSSGNPLSNIELISVYSGTVNNFWGGYEMSYSRYGHASVFLNGHLYIIGGTDGTAGSAVESSIECYRFYDFPGADFYVNELVTVPGLNQGRAFHGAGICLKRDPDDRTKEKAVIVVAGGMQNGVSTGSIENLYLERDAVNSPADGDSVFIPSASNTWQKAGTTIETTLAACSTARLKLSTESNQQSLYLFGGQRVYNTTVTTCPDSNFSNCTQSTNLVTEPVSDVLSYNPFSDTLEKINSISAGARVWSTTSEYTDDDGNSFACLIGGSDSDGAPSTSVNSFGFAVESFSTEPPPADPIVTYPDERVQCDVDLNMYGGKKELVGAGPVFILSSKYTTRGYEFYLDSGLRIDLFNIRLDPIRTEIKAYHYVNPASDDIMEINIKFMNDDVVLYQKQGKEVSLALTDIKDMISDDKEDQDGDDDEEDDTTKQKLPGEWDDVNMFEVSWSLFKKKGKPPEKYIGSFFGLMLVVKWDCGFKAGWDFAIGFEKGEYTWMGGSIDLGLSQYGGLEDVGDSYSEGDTVTYNRAFIKPSAYGAIWGYLSAGVTAGSLLTLGIEANFDIIRLDVALILANNFEFDDIESPTRYGTRRSIGWTGTLSLVKGEANLFVEVKLPAVCSKKKWGVKWYYPCLKPKKKVLPWPSVSFCAFKITLWDQHHYFGEVSDWVRYDSSLTLESSPPSALEIITDAYDFIFNW